jgi:hypothetical protein
MLKRLVVIVLLLIAAVRAEALEYTDVYSSPSEPGWGVLLVQSDTTQFLAFFIYAADGKPTWYTALLSDDGTGNYSGALYASTGTYFASPWHGYAINAVGTVSFTPTDLYHATLTYTVNGVGTVTKAVQRETLTPYVLSGNYSGSMSGSISGCTDPTANDAAFRGRYGLSATQVADESVTLVFTFVDAIHNGIVCTLSGPLTHLGRLYQFNAQITCSGPGQSGNPHSVTINSLHPTGQGIEGRLTGQTGGGCTASLHFAAVLNLNN